VTIDALPDATFRGHVTEIGNSPIQTSATAQSTSSARQATNFKVVVTLDEQIEDVRPGFTCTADITTATRAKVIAVPIQAVTVREVTFDTSGKMVRAPKKKKKASGGSVETRLAAQEELKPGETRKETEGVFLLRGNTTEFVPVKVGIAGERYFEAISGLREGDLVITGPFDSVRQMDDGDEVKLEEPESRK
jgi:HlyD family secretion protein